MRDILTGLAILVILLLTTALIGPHVIDWNSHRHLVEKRLAALVGAPVSSRGDIAITFLPVPTLSIHDVTVGEVAASNVTMKSFDASLSLTAMLRGEVRITSAALDEPAVRIIPGPEADQAATVRSPNISPSNIIIERVVINDGTISLARPGRSSLEAGKIYVDAEASSLAGPYRGKSRFETVEGARNLSFATGKYENGKLRIKALLEDEARAVRYDLDGFVAPFTGLDGNGSVFSGQLSASGNIALPRRDGYGQVLWHLQSPATASLQTLHLDNLDLTLGNEGAVKLTGAADLALGGEPLLSLILSTKQLDLDRILSPDPKVPTEHRPTEVVALVANMIGAAAASSDLTALSQKPIPLHFDVSIGNTVIGGDSIAGLAIKGTLKEGQLTLDQLSGGFPGRAELDVNGTVAGIAGPRFDGQIGIDARDARRFLTWYSGTADIPLKTIKASLRMSAAPGLLIIGATDAQLDDGRFSGVVERRIPSDIGAVPIVSATVKGDGLPLELARLLQNDVAQTDLDLKLDLVNIKVGAVSAGQVKAHVIRTRSGLVLDDVDVQNLGGLQLKGRSSMGRAGGGLLIDVDARSLDSVVDMLQRIGYSALARSLTQRSSALNGIRATIRGDSRVDGSRFLNTLQLDGRAGKTTVNGLAQWSTLRTAANALPDSDVDLHITLKSPDGGEMLAQSGFETLRIDAGPGALDISATGQWLKGFQTKANGTIAGLKIGIEGRATPTDDFKPFEGSLTLEARDLAVPARVLAIAFPPVPQGMGARFVSKATLAGAKLALTGLDADFGRTHLQGDMSFDLAQHGRIAGELRLGAVDARLLAAVVLGTDFAPLQNGGWSAANFGPAQTPPLAGDVWIETLQLQLADGIAPVKAGFTYRFENGLASFEQVELQAAFGWIKGNLTLRRTGTIVSSDLHLNTNGMKFPLAGGSLSGQINGDLSVSGSGNSPASLMGALAGGGTLQHTGIGVARLDPEALSRTLSAMLESNANTEPDSVAQRFDQEVAKAALSLPSGDSTITVAQGVMRLSPFKMPVQGGDVQMTLAADFARLRSEAKAEYQLALSPDKWIGRPPAAAVFWSGSLLLPDRRGDTTVLSNGLAAISIARDLDRIQVYEQDARERAAFIRRQRASEQERRRTEDEKRRVEAALKAEEEAKREADRRADEEAKRLVDQERRRQDDEAKRDAARRAAEQQIRALSAPPLNLAPPLGITPPLDLKAPAVNPP